MVKAVRGGPSGTGSETQAGRRPTAAGVDPVTAEPGAPQAIPFADLGRQARMAPRTLSPTAILALQRTIGNRAVSLLLHPPATPAAHASPTPGSSLGDAHPASPPVRIQRLLMTEAALKTAAGGTSWGTSKSKYDLILAALGKYPKLVRVDQKLPLLAGLKTNVAAWLAANKDRQKKRDNDKRRALAELTRQVEYELQIANPAAPAMDPAMQAAFASADDTVRYLKAHIGAYDALVGHYDRIFPTKPLHAVLVSYFESKMRIGLLNLDKFHSLSADFPHPSVKRAIAEAYKKVAGHDIMLGGLEIPQGNQQINDRDIARAKAIWTEVMGAMKYDSLSIPLQFIAKVRADREGTPGKKLADIYNEYTAVLPKGVNPGKADCVGMAKEVQRRLRDQLGIDSHIVGSTGGNYLNRLPAARNESIGATSPVSREAQDFAVYSHASVIVPYVHANGAPQYLHLETANGPDPDNFKRFVSLAETMAMDPNAKGEAHSLKGDVSRQSPIENPEELAKKHIRCKWRMYLTDDAATSGGRAYIDLVEGSVWLGGNGKADMEVAKTFKGTSFNFEAALKKPAETVILRIGDADVPKSNVEAVTIFFQMIKEQFKLPDTFVENMLYLAGHMDEFGQDILFEPISQLRKVVELKREALIREKAAEVVSTIAPRPANFVPEKFEQAKRLVGQAHESALRRNGDESAAKYREAIALFSTLVARQEIGSNFVRIVTARRDDLAGLETDLMAYIKSQGTKATDVENDYHTMVPPLGFAVPAELGAIVHSAFTKYFQAQGKGKAAFQTLMRDYPTLQYRIKPTYRYLFGESELQKILGESLADEMAAAVPDPAGEDNQRLKTAFKTHGIYRTPPGGFKSATGIGNGFDAQFNPATGQLKISLKVCFDFKDRPPDADRPGVGAPRGVGADSYGQDRWTDPAKAAWKRDYVSKTLGIWNASPAVIKCIRPGWDDVSATSLIEIAEVAKDQAHYTIEVDKARLVDERGTTKLKSGGVSGLGGNKLLLQEWDIADKIQDPFLHQYLHQAEKTGNIEPAYRQDRNRLINAANLMGRIAFQPGAALPVEASRVAILIEELKRQEIPSSLAHLHPLKIVGAVAGGGDNALKLQRANYLSGQLTTSGVRHAISVGESAENFDGAIVQAAPENPAIIDTYVTRWSRFTAAHEFGHFLGLMDEYYQAASDDTVKRLISDGHLPPDTPGDHFTRNPNANVKKEAEKQAATLKMLEANNISSPALTTQTGNANMPKTTNLMTGGFEITATNYVTFWEALTTMTAGEVESRYWRIASGRGASA